MRYIFNSALVAICLQSLPALAEFDVNFYDKERQNEAVFSYVKYYVNGVQDGLAWANTMNEQKGLHKIYCPPSKLALNADNAIDLIDSEIKEPWVIELRKKQRLPVSLILIHALQRTFPCN